MFRRASAIFGNLALLLFLLVQNIHATDVSGSISTNTTWTLANSPYIVRGSITVPSGVTLTVESGVVVKFVPTYLYFVVNGVLDAQGTASSPVIFTSFKDDQYGGDANGNGSGDSPIKGDWGYLQINNSAVTLKYCIFRYGGSYTRTDCLYGSCNTTINNYMVWANRCSPTIDHCIIENAYDLGIYYASSPGNAIISNDTIRNCNVGLYYTGSGTSTQPQFTDNYIAETFVTGLHLANCEPTFLNNKLVNNAAYPLKFESYVKPTYSGNTITGNKYQGIAVLGPVNTSGSLNYSWGNADGLNLPYIVVGNITVGTNVTLGLTSGTVVKFSTTNLTMTVSGNLDLQGTASAPVIFTSIKDDVYGGDANGDGTATLPAKGDWGYIQVNSSTTILDYCIIRFGGAYTNTYWNGSSNTTVVYNYAIWANSCSPTLNHCLIENAYDVGVYYANCSGNAIISNDTIRNCNTGLYYSGSGTSTQPQFTNNYISETSTAGLHVANCEPTFLNNKIVNSAAYPLKFESYVKPTYSGNTVTGNKYQGIAVLGPVNTSGSLNYSWGNADGLNLPYIVVGNITVGTNVTLGLAGGTVVKFSSTNLTMTVSGNLDLQGTASAPVIFTSIKDDVYGGDANGDGTATLPAKGDWGYIQVNSSATILDYCIIRFGGAYTNTYWNGSSNTTVVYNYAIWANSCSPTLDHCLIENAYDIGVYYANSSGNAVISNDTIRNCNTGLYYSGSGTSTQPQFTNNYITKTSIAGLQLANCEPTLQNNQLVYNSAYPLKLECYVKPTYSGNTINGNKFQGIAVLGSTTTGGVLNSTWINANGLNLPYIVVENIIIGNNVTLGIASGMVVKFISGKTMSVSGNLNVQGTVLLPVVFTSFKDDEYGGDANGDGTVSLPAKGDWGYLQINNSAITIAYSKFRYGGNLSNTTYMVWANSCSPTIDHCIIENAYNTGIYATGPAIIQHSDIQSCVNGIVTSGARVTISNCNITGNTIGIQTNGNYTSPLTLVSNSNIINNTTYNIQTNGAAAGAFVTATNNYWGTTIGTAIAAKFQGTNTTFNYTPMANSPADLSQPINPPGDFNASGRTDGVDLAILATTFGLSQGATTYDPRCDLFTDAPSTGRIDGFDLAIFSANFGKNGALSKRTAWTDSMKPGIYIGMPRSGLTANTEYEFPIDLTGISDIRSVAFDVVFPDSLINFESITEGALLSDSGRTNTVFLKSADSNRIIVGITRLDASGANRNGTIAWLKVRTAARVETSAFAEIRLENIALFNSSGAEIPLASTSVKAVFQALPKAFSASLLSSDLHRSKIKVAYAIPAVTMVQITVFDVKGRCVQVLKNEMMNAGNYEVMWNASDRLSGVASSGAYLIRVQAGDQKKSMPVRIVH